MGRSIIEPPGNQQAKMTYTQIINGGRISISADYKSTDVESTDFESTDFESNEFDDTKFESQFGTGRNMKPMKKMSSMKKFSKLNNTLKKMPSVSKVGWDDASSIASCSLQSATDKTVHNDSNTNPVTNDRRRPALHHDYADVTTSKVSTALSKYDEDLSNILIRQTNPVVAVNGETLQRISLLGNGQFCHVYSYAGSLPLLPGQAQNEGGENLAGRKKTYAMKSINFKRVGDDDELIVAASDLASEAMILSELNHKNIIKLRGLCCNSFSGSFVNEGALVGRDVSTRSIGFDGRSGSRKNLNRSLKRLESFNTAGLNRSLKRLTSFKMTKRNNGIKGYFLLLDVMTEVLSNQLAKDRIVKERGGGTKIRKKSLRIKAMYKRIEHVATGIVAGMRYLHSHDIVVRDLKPGNVGFDEEMNVRLFDFGMARKVSECDSGEICGSPRYMAPEVMQCSGYTLKVDVYSFGILLYELCTLEVPFENACALMRLNQKKKKASCLQSIFRKQPRKSNLATEINDDSNGNSGENMTKEDLLLEYYERVVYDELRPSNNNLDQIIPCPKMRILIQECWNADPDQRPSFDEIATRLEDVFNSQ
jgi:serine/threonine protein kinase